MPAISARAHLAGEVLEDDPRHGRAARVGAGGDQQRAVELRGAVRQVTAHSSQHSQ